MGVDIKFLNTDGTPIGAEGVNLGVIRKGKYQTIPVIIKNDGTDDAKNVFVQGTTLHKNTEVTTDIYNKELTASKWKTFSLLPDEGFVSTLNLPNISAGKQMVGIQKYVESFVDSSNSWTMDSFATRVYTWTGNNVVVTPADTSTNRVTAFMVANNWGMHKDIDLTLKVLQPPVTTGGSAYTSVLLRRNSNGDNKGYILNMKRVTTTLTGGTLTFELRYGEGYTSTGSQDYGSILVSSEKIPYTDWMPIRVKLFTNASGLPEIKLWANNIADTDTPVTWSPTTTPITSYVDTANRYQYAGYVGICFGGNGTNLVSGGTEKHGVDDASMITEDLNGKVYIRSLVGDGAEDAVYYDSAMELFFDPV
jgi:hypothetical protein